MKNNFSVRSELNNFLLKKKLVLLQERALYTVNYVDSGQIQNLCLIKKYLLILKRKLQVCKKINFLHLKTLGNLSLSRHPNRRHSLDYINSLLNYFEEFHGDNRYEDDPSIICGFGMLNARYICVIVHEKGRFLNDKIKRNFGCSKPSGFRKAMRTIKKAECLGIPILSILDTAGAFPGIESENNNISEAISLNIKEMFYVKVPIVSLLIGEGGSGGALGIGISDKVIMLEYSYFSVISPEGCSSILWKSNLRVEEASKSLKLFSKNIKRFGVADLLIREDLDGDKVDSGTYANLKKNLEVIFNKLTLLKSSSLVRKRFLKYRFIGEFKA